jgi:DNA (cytosine-5)-methyltransferase 1
MAGYTFASFYSGAGGMDLGFKEAGFIPIFANDIDPFAIQTLNGLLGVNHGIAADVTTISLPEDLSVDLVIGGPPCQGFSVAGKMNPTDPRSEHVWKFLELVSTLKPRAFVMENVKNLAVNDRWAAIKNSLIEGAELLGYSTKIFLLSASDFEVPQNRERMFLVGIRGGAPLSPIPITHENRPTVRDALELLPKFGTPGNDGFCTAKITTAQNPVMRKSTYAGMIFNGAGRPMNPDAPAPTLPASMGGNRTPIIDQSIIEGAKSGFVEKYHAHLLAGGDVWEDVPSSLRRITVEEAASIQSFPIGMNWAGPISARFRQIGNAVPPRLAYHVALSVMRTLENLPTEALPEVPDYSMDELKAKTERMLLLL